MTHVLAAPVWFVGPYSKAQVLAWSFGGGQGLKGFEVVYLKVRWIIKTERFFENKKRQL